MASNVAIPLDSTHVLNSLTRYTQQLTTIVDKTANDVILNPTESTEDAFHKNLYQLIPCLVDCYQAMNARTVSEFHNNPIISQSVEVSHLIDYMDKLTDRYHGLLMKVDAVIQSKVPKGFDVSEIILTEVLTCTPQSLQTVLQQNKYTILVLLRHFA